MQGMKILLLALLAFFVGSGESNPYHRSYYDQYNSKGYGDGFQSRFEKKIKPTPAVQTQFEKEYEMMWDGYEWVQKALFDRDQRDWNDDQARGIEDALPIYKSEREYEVARGLGNLFQDHQENNYDEYQSLLDALGYDSNPFDVKSGRLGTGVSDDKDKAKKTEESSQDKATNTKTETKSAADKAEAETVAAKPEEKSKSEAKSAPVKPETRANETKTGTTKAAAKVNPAPESTKTATNATKEEVKATKRPDLTAKPTKPAPQPTQKATPKTTTVVPKIVGVVAQPQEKFAATMKPAKKEAVADTIKRESSIEKVPFESVGSLTNNEDAKDDAKLVPLEAYVEPGLPNDRNDFTNKEDTDAEESKVPPVAPYVPAEHQIAKKKDSSPFQASHPRRDQLNDEFRSENGFRDDMVRSEDGRHRNSYRSDMVDPFYEYLFRREFRIPTRDQYPKRSRVVY